MATDCTEGKPLLPCTAILGCMDPCHCSMNHFFFFPLDLTEIPCKDQHHWDVQLSFKLKRRKNIPLISGGMFPDPLCV